MKNATSNWKTSFVEGSSQNDDQKPVSWLHFLISSICPSPRNSHLTSTVAVAGFEAFITPRPDICKRWSFGMRLTGTQGAGYNPFPLQEVYISTCCTYVNDIEWWYTFHNYIHTFGIFLERICFILLYKRVFSVNLRKSCGSPLSPCLCYSASLVQCSHEAGCSGVGHCEQLLTVRLWVLSQKNKWVYNHILECESSLIQYMIGLFTHSFHKSYGFVTQLTWWNLHMLVSAQCTSGQFERAETIWKFSQVFCLRIVRKKNFFAQKIPCTEMSSKDLSQKADMTDIPNWFPFGRCQKTLPSLEKLVIYYPLDNWEWGKFERCYPNNVAFFSTSRCCKRERERERERGRERERDGVEQKLTSHHMFLLSHRICYIPNDQRLLETLSPLVATRKSRHHIEKLLSNPFMPSMPSIMKSSKLFKNCKHHRLPPQPLPDECLPVPTSRPNLRILHSFFGKVQDPPNLGPPGPLYAYGKWSITKLSQERN